METIIELPILKCKGTKCQKTQDFVVQECGLRIVLVDSQGEENFAFIRTIPREPEVLITGLLFTSRIITKYSDILRLQIRNQLAKVQLADHCSFHEKLEALRPTARFVTGVCGPEESALGTWRACDLPPITSPIQFAPQMVNRAVKRLSQKMHLYRQTGGTHGAALVDQEGELVVVAEDVGRHNAIDRIIGKGLKTNIEFSSSFIVSTGRLTEDLVLKGAVARVPLLVSISAAVASGVELADAAGITLVGFARGSLMNIYTHPSRLQDVQL